MSNKNEAPYGQGTEAAAANQPTASSNPSATGTGHHGQGVEAARRWARRPALRTRAHYLALAALSLTAAFSPNTFLLLFFTPWEVVDLWTGLAGRALYYARWVLGGIGVFCLLQVFIGWWRRRYRIEGGWIHLDVAVPWMRCIDRKPLEAFASGHVRANWYHRLLRMGTVDLVNHQGFVVFRLHGVASPQRVLSEITKLAQQRHREVRNAAA